MVIAMLFVVLFSVLALGFYSSVTSSVRVAHNEISRSNANLAAESGLQYLGYQLASVKLSTAVTDQSQLFDQLTAALSTKLAAASGNLTDADNTATVRTPATYTNTATFPASDGQTHLLKRYYIPGYYTASNTPQPYFMRLGTGASANSNAASIQVSLESRPDPTAPTNDAKRTNVIALAVLGRAISSSSATPVYRALSYDLSSSLAQTTSTQSVTTGGGAWTAPIGSILTYSAVSFTGGGVIVKANVTAIPATTSTVPLTMGGGGNSIQGTFSYPTANPAPTGVGSNGNTVTTIAKLATSPDKPVIDTTVFQSYVPATTAAPLVASSGTSGQKYSNVLIGPSTGIGSTNTYTDIRIKAGANPTFGNNCILNGVIYVESPNKLTIGGGAKVNGVIVMEPSTSAPYNSSTKNNSIVLNNGVVFKDASQATTTGLPSSEITKLASLATLTNKSTMVLAPDAYTEFAGGLAMQNSAAIIARQINFNNIGTATAFAGVILQLGSDAAFTCTGGIGLTSTGGSTSFPGVNTPSSTTTTTTTTSTTTFASNRSSYTEVKPWSYVSEP